MLAKQDTRRKNHFKLLLYILIDQIQDFIMSNQTQNYAFVLPNHIDITWLPIFLSILSFTVIEQSFFKLKFPALDLYEFSHVPWR